MKCTFLFLNIEFLFLDPCLNTSCGVGVCTRKANASYEAVCSCPVSRKGVFCELPRGMFINIFKRFY